MRIWSTSSNFFDHDIDQNQEIQDLKEVINRHANLIVAQSGRIEEQEDEAFQAARLELHLRDQFIDERAENKENEYGYDARSSDDANYDYE